MSYGVGLMNGSGMKSNKYVSQ